MSWISGIPILGELLDKFGNRVLPDKSESRAAQSRINEQEVAGGPPSRLRLWRGLKIRIIFLQHFSRN